MKKSNNTRRQFVKNTTAVLSFLSLSSAGRSETYKQVEKRKVVCVGGHPDDPESGCGGTLAKFTNAGDDVTIIYLTTGEAGIEGKTHNEAATIRKEEAINACKILNAKPVFAGQIDGDTVTNNEWVNKMQQLIATEKPDIVFTHWPIDSHKDHQSAGMLTIQTWMRIQKKFTLYFFEVCAGNQTMTFHPTNYVDISDTQEQKRKAIYCHTSQDPDSIYGCGHASMEEFRGRELGVKAGEAFIRMNGQGMGGSVL